MSLIFGNRGFLNIFLYSLYQLIGWIMGSFLLRVFILNLEKGSLRGVTYED
jgi:hypothetical protein